MEQDGLVVQAVIWRSCVEKIDLSAAEDRDQATLLIAKIAKARTFFKSCHFGGPHHDAMHKFKKQLQCYGNSTEIRKKMPLDPWWEGHCRCPKANWTHTCAKVPRSWVFLRY